MLDHDGDLHHEEAKCEGFQLCFLNASINAPVILQICFMTEIFIVKKLNVNGFFQLCFLSVSINVFGILWMWPNFWVHDVFGIVII